MSNSPEINRRSLIMAAAATGLATTSILPASSVAAVPVLSKTVMVDGLDIFYREAGPQDGPVVLLLHGFPTSSHMFRDLIPALAAKYRVIAPDYPGFGNSATPSLAQFPYTFAAIADVVDGFAQAVGAGTYVIYMQDYGGPVGFRLALKHPERVRGFIVQNAVANIEGWNPDVVKSIAPFWKNRNAETEAPVRALLKPDMIKWQYTQGATRLERLSPDAWTHDQAGLGRQGNGDLQVEMLFNYQDNLAQYPAWQEYLKSRKPLMLIVWGKNDPIFTLAAVAFFKSEIPDAEVNLYDSGHFALETHVDEIAERINAFLDRLPT